MVHELKITSKYFVDILIHNKNFEIRKNDRNYHVDDILILKEYDSIKHIYSGREITVKVSYIHYGNGDFGLSSDYCVIGFNYNLGRLL